MLLVLLLGLCSSTTFGREVVTNQFHVLIKREAAAEANNVADDIAREAGFHNLGPVSNNSLYRFRACLVHLIDYLMQSNT